LKKEVEERWRLKTEEERKNRKTEQKKDRRRLTEGSPGGGFDFDIRG